MNDHRRPPALPFEGQTGVCRTCGGALPKGRRRYCGDACSQISDYTWHPRWAGHMLARDTFGEGEARCFECGLTAREALAAHRDTEIVHVAGAPVTDDDVDRYVAWRPLELDHIRPLWSLSPTEALELKWWLPGNLQFLCRWCHKAKSAREARQRAMEKRMASVA